MAPRKTQYTRDQSLPDNMRRERPVSVERAQGNLRDLCNSYVESQTSRRPQVSDEVRQARGPNEMDATDMANVLNESRYARLGTGRPFSAQDYDRLRRGLDPYKIARGVEQK
jgi:hypothetical protein